MKKFLYCILRGIMSFIYSVMKLLFPMRDRVLFISRESNAAGENFLMIAEAIRRRSPNTDLRFSCKREKRSRFGLSNPFLMVDRMRLLASSRVCITESDSAEFGILNHRSGLKIIQIWHSMAPFKKFGWQTVGTSDGITVEFAEGIRLHAGYDYVVVGSEFAKGIFSDAMRTDESKILPLGLPITDNMLNSDSESDRFKLWKLHPSTCGKKIILYAPTLRKNSFVPWRDIAQNIDFDKTALVVKLHPRDKTTYISDERIVVDKEMTAQEIMRAADAVITDYSGVAAEASLLKKPIFFYVSDIERYSGQSGLNINPAELFTEISFDDSKKLMEALEQDINIEAIENLHEKLAGACKGSSSENIAALVAEQLEYDSKQPEKVFKSSRMGDFLARCVYEVKYLGAPVDPMLILFESKQHCSYEGAVKELFESVYNDKKFESCRFAWAVSSPEDNSIPKEYHVLTVKYGSSEHMQLHARAGAVVSDAPVSNRVKLRDEQRYFVADSFTKEALRRIMS